MNANGKFWIVIVVMMALRVSGQTAAPVQIPVVATTASAETARIIVGFDQTGVPNSDPTQHLFADLFFARPLPVGKLSLWGDVRLGSVPQTITSTLVTAPADVVKSIGTIQVTELARSAEFAAGLGYRIAGDGTAKVSVDAIAAYGATAPLAATSSVNVTQENRYNRQYRGGFRIISATGTTHVLDVTVGQNEAITGGGLRGAVVRFDGIYALPVPKIGLAYLTGTAELAVSRRNPGTDLYRIGLAFDFFQILKTLGIK